MKVVHLCLGCFYPEGYSYQENLLPLYHKKMGFEVEVIASLQTFDENGKVSYMEHACTYVDKNGLRVKRLDYKKPQSVFRKLKRFIGTYEALSESKPDVLFIHGCQFLDMNIVTRYVKKQKDIKVYVDNHADFSNSGRNFISYHFLHRILWKRSAQIILPYVNKFYGVLPARVDFLTDVYDIPKEKVELLVMGGEDDKVEDALRPVNIEKIRTQFGVRKSDFLIVTGGKIDNSKRQILLLMEAVNRIKRDDVKLIVFGSVIPELKEKIEELTTDYSKYIGWIESDETAYYYAAADLVVFPGRHSVFWEQVVAMGIPMICKSWDGTKHVDLGGNVIFVNKDSSTELYNIINELLTNKEKYNLMKSVAQSDKRKDFLYSSIAKRSIEIN